MNILYWNLKKHNNAHYILKLISMYEIDIAVFSEYTMLDQSSITKEFPCFSFSLGMHGCEKVLFLFNNNISFEIRRESDRYAMYSFDFKGKSYIIVGLHLPANPASNSDDRKCVISDLMSDLTQLEKESNIENTIVIGDFNASPFDSELTQKNMFNAVPFLDIIQKREKTKFHDKYYRRFYNPMIHYISEDTKQYGSFYYTGGSNTIVWYSYDQVIVRKALSQKINNVFYCKSIDQTSLLSSWGVPKESISDHLPLIVEVLDND